MNKEPNKTKLIVLGGLGEIGKNMYCLMHEDEIIIIDAGISFANLEVLGIDYIIPDYTFLKNNQDKIKALIITHGHEDHIGGIPFLLQAVNIPAIHAPIYAKGLIELKLLDRLIKYENLFSYTDETILKFKHFEIEFFRTTHSIPNSHGLYIKTPNGTIVSTGDFKFDLTPVGPIADLHKIAEIGKRGVDLLISDSTNALNEGVSISESKVDLALNDIFNQYANNRIIIGTFASNVYRLKHIAENCFKHNRKLCVFGRSMENAVEIATTGGYIEHKDIFIKAEEANALKPQEVCLLCTGSQGEPLAALSRIANGNDKKIKLRPDDIIVFSSSPIPGNALSIGRIINKLYLQGVKVFTNTLIGDIHTSGHANIEELKLMIRLVMPKYVMPYHGDYRMLKNHADSAIECGVPKENTFILQNGDILNLDRGVITKDKETIPSSDIYVDGGRIGEIAEAVLRDRKIMASDGILVVIANINMKERKLLIRPNITTRGFIQVNENEELIKKIEVTAGNAITEKLQDSNNGFNEIKSHIIYTLNSFIQELTGRKPIILPIILDIKNEK